MRKGHGRWVLWIGFFGVIFVCSTQAWALGPSNSAGAGMPPFGIETVALSGSGSGSDMLQFKAGSHLMGRATVPRRLLDKRRDSLQVLTQSLQLAFRRDMCQHGLLASVQGKHAASMAMFLHRGPFLSAPVFRKSHHRPHFRLRG